MATVILADSNELIRIGLRSVLSTIGDIQIAGEANDNDSLVKQVSSFKPDIVLIDYASEGFTIDVIQEIHDISKDIKFVAITQEQSGQTMVHALRSGIKSHVKKDCDIQEIIDAVNETHKNNSFYCGKILEKIAQENIDLTELEAKEFSCEPVTISEREEEIIAMIAEGYTNTQIADHLFISAHTVNTHRKNIMAKLGVKNTAGIVMYAVKSNIVHPNKYLFAVSTQD